MMVFIRMAFLLSTFFVCGVHSMERKPQLLPVPNKSLQIKWCDEVLRWVPSSSSIAQGGAHVVNYATRFALPVLASAYNNDTSPELGPVAKNGSWVIPGVVITGGVVLLGCAFVFRKVQHRKKKICHVQQGGVYIVTDDEEVMEQSSSGNSLTKSSAFFTKYSDLVEVYTAPGKYRPGSNTLYAGKSLK